MAKKKRPARWILIVDGDKAFDDHLRALGLYPSKTNPKQYLKFFDGEEKPRLAELIRQLKALGFSRHRPAIDAESVAPAPPRTGAEAKRQTWAGVPQNHRRADRKRKSARCRCPEEGARSSTTGGSSRRSRSRAPFQSRPTNSKGGKSKTRIAAPRRPSRDRPRMGEPTRLTGERFRFRKGFAAAARDPTQPRHGVITVSRCLYP